MCQSLLLRNHIAALHLVLEGLRLASSISALFSFDIRLLDQACSKLVTWQCM